jgi:cytochrome d ubiquinol oxidase subunit II
VVVIIFLPLVLVYQAWTYWVFRKRVSASDFRPPAATGAAPEPESAAQPEPVSPPGPPQMRPGT